MSEILSEFEIFDTCPKNVKQNIKIFHAFQNDFAICVTNDDKVYAFGEKYFSKNSWDMKWKILTTIIY